MLLYTLNKFMNIWKLFSKSGLVSGTSETTQLLQGEKLVTVTTDENVCLELDFLYTLQLSMFKTYILKH